MQLTVPHRRQLGNGYCLPDCLEMALAFLDLEYDQTHIARALGTRPNLGSPFFAVTELASQIRGLKTLNIEFCEIGEPEDLVIAPN